ncbi:hypothetical protein CROQUDRAFT_657616 [Cronartium quercuum f. sp. fusiforme G11]|uniref:t-SNARE coiled-coil homology domain-containing protein n=1 Tax=Cronartium quercuum f. sp. fusiforme G11 TaxID=708437 RepID=A0A9P6NIM2_9BASI|nr:hypothetical protein CROQUDRAFT_657616 [Cronartium quercuum f. sp. fusiforme G11]
MSSRSVTGPAPTPVRLSVLSSSTLQALLDLSKLNELSIAASPSMKTKLIQNLTSFRTGLMHYRDRQGDEIIDELRRQYDRIISLSKGVTCLEEDLEGLDLSLPGPSKLIETDETENQIEDEELSEMGPSALEHQPLIGSQSFLVDMPDKIKPPTRLTSRRTIEEDQEIMRNQNEDVQIMQRAMLEDQDRSLDALSNAISRQRDLSLHISSELEVQESLLTDLDENMDFTSNRLNKANRKMNSLFQKMARDGACWTIFGLVVLLLILIILLK